MTRNMWRWLYVLIVLLTLMAGLYLLHWVFGAMQTASDIVALFFFSWLLQFFLTPSVDLLHRRGLPRLLAVSYVYVVIGLVMVIILAFSLPAAYGQAQHLADALASPKTYQVISNTTNALERVAIERFHVPPTQVQEFTKQYSVSLEHGAIKAGTRLQQLIKSNFTQSSISSSATAFLGFLSTLNYIFLQFVIVLILAFYMTLDGHKLVHRALRYFPPAVSEIMESVHAIINRKFGGYMRGQILLAGIYGALTYVITILFGIPYPIFVGLIAAIMMLVPFIGTILAVIPALLGYVLVHATDKAFPVLGLIILLLVLGAVQHVVINLMAPRVMGTAMDMHPLLVMLGLLLGAKVAGLWGAIFGVPVFGVLLDTADLIYRRVMERRYGFHPPSAEQLDAEDEPSGGGAAPRHHRNVPAPATARAEPLAPAPSTAPMGVAPPAIAATPPPRDPEREMTTTTR